jgi:hypothetical protein
MYNTLFVFYWYSISNNVHDIGNIGNNKHILNILNRKIQACAEIPFKYKLGMFIMLRLYLVLKTTMLIITIC